MLKLRVIILAVIYAESYMESIVLSVFMLNVVMLSVVAPFSTAKHMRHPA
jgi:hypothetical protein